MALWNILIGSAVVLLCYSSTVNGLRAQNKTIHPCSSEIYCYGRLLHTIQMANPKLFNDSKTFVDMKLVNPPDETLKAFDKFMQSHGQNPSSRDLRNFLNSNFEQPGSEFVDWIPDDWTIDPKFLQRIEDKDYRKWASDLNAFWKHLGRKMTTDVEKNPDLYSIIHVKNPVIVPGGRFREFYYWDSYWIIRGLLLSEMTKTAKGMLDNFLSIIDRYGFIPNGGRVYYAERSQPPLLAPMIKSYVEKMNDREFMLKSLPILEREFHYWLENHLVTVKGHSLAVYGDRSVGPRPESYREDIETGEVFVTEQEKEDIYSELKAAAESGMDFSSRWFIKDGTNAGDLRNLKCRYIVPVELNAILFWNAKIISEFHLKNNNNAKADEFKKYAKQFYDAIQAVLWDEEVGAWLDYDLINNKRRNYFVPTNLSPLWMNCYNDADREKITKHVLRYINSLKLDKFPGGVPNTLEKTGQQWDSPNVWPPMQYILVKGLSNLKDKEASELAFKWAARWVGSNFLAFKDTRAMFEKYNAEEYGGSGDGGEYDVQLGFGWTNGVILEFLDTYGDRLKLSNNGGGSSAKLDRSAVGVAIIIAALTTIITRITA